MDVSETFDGITSEVEWVYRRWQLLGDVFNNSWRARNFQETAQRGRCWRYLAQEKWYGMAIVEKNCRPLCNETVSFYRGIGFSDCDGNIKCNSNRNDFGFYMIRILSRECWIFYPCIQRVASVDLQNRSSYANAEVWDSEAKTFNDSNMHDKLSRSLEELINGLNI